MQINSCDQLYEYGVALLAHWRIKHDILSLMTQIFWTQDIHWNDSDIHSRKNYYTNVLILNKLQSGFVIFLGPLRANLNMFASTRDAWTLWFLKIARADLHGKIRLSFWDEIVFPAKILLNLNNELNSELQRDLIMLLILISARNICRIYLKWFRELFIIELQNRKGGLCVSCTISSPT